MRAIDFMSYEEQEAEAKRREIKSLEKQREEAYRKAEEITLFIKQIKDRE